MQRVLEERWKPKENPHLSLMSSKDLPPSDPNMLILALHKKLQRVCGHRGVGRDKRHTDNRKGPTIEATFLHRQLANAYELASKDGYRFPPPPKTRHGKVKTKALFDGPHWRDHVQT